MSRTPPRKRLGRPVTHEEVPWDENDEKSVTSVKREDKRVKKEIKKLNPKELVTLEDLLEYYDISTNSWDYLIIGDGSGTTWQHEMGWGSALIARSDRSRKSFCGGMSNGTNNMAELMQVLHPLMFLANNTNFDDKPEGLIVHVVSDSEYVVNGLKQQNPIWVSQLKLNRELWMAIHMARRRGIEIIGHHIPRNSTGLSTLGHNLANKARISQIGLLASVAEEVQAANQHRDEKDQVKKDEPGSEQVGEGSGTTQSSNGEDC